MDELETLREEIRGIDTELARLFEKRMAVSASVAAVKIRKNLPIYDAAREEENIEALCGFLSDAANRPLFSKWYRLLMDASKARQAEIKDKKS